MFWMDSLWLNKYSQHLLYSLCVYIQSKHKRIKERDDSWVPNSVYKGSDEYSRIFVYITENDNKRKENLV